MQILLCRVEGQDERLLLINHHDLVMIAFDLFAARARQAHFDAELGEVFGEFLVAFLPAFRGRRNQGAHLDAALHGIAHGVAHNRIIHPKDGHLDALRR